MAYGEAQLSGSADYRVGLDIYPVQPNPSTNSTTFWWGTYLQNPNGQGAWFLDSGSWGVNLAEGWHPRGGTWNRPQSKAGTVSEILGSGYVDVGHDANGWRPGFWNDASISSGSSFIGSGSVRVWVDAPRIPKAPTQVPAPTVSDVRSRSMRVSWTPPVDQGGTPVDAYILRVHTDPNPEAPGYTDHAVNGATLYKDLTGLMPGTTYSLKVYPRNAVGYGPGSPIGTGRTLAGIYVSDGTQWVPATLRVSSEGDTWVEVMPKISDGTTWKDPESV